MTRRLTRTSHQPMGTLLLFGILFLAACYPVDTTLPVGEANPIVEISPTPDILEAGTPERKGTPEACFFNWARSPLPELTSEFQAALEEIQPDARGYAEAYGENCLNADNEVVRFLAMETDFYLIFQVETLEDKVVLGEFLERGLNLILTQYPAEKTPGPQPGYISITFESPVETTKLWFTVTAGQMALEQGARGKELYDLLRDT